jgi:hypothetical protein
MSRYRLSHLGDAALSHELSAMVARERTATAGRLTHRAEFDQRRLHLPAGFPTPYEYCLGELHLSEDAACRRIRAARAARQFPALFPALGDGRLSLSAVLLLAPHLTSENVADLLAAAAYKTRSEIERLVAERFPRPELATRLQALTETAGAPGDTLPSAPARMESGAPSGTVKPLSPQRYALQVTLGQGSYEMLEYARALLGHQVAPGDLATVLGRALEALIVQLERRRFGAASRPRRGPKHSSRNPRHGPAAVKHAVWERDRGQCTFVSGTGRRCPDRSGLEFDHVHEVARGGEATVQNLRLRCRGHDQYAAGRRFGAGFMHEKREQARAAARARREAAEARRRAEEQQRQAGESVRQAADEIIPYLRHLGFRADQSRRLATEACEVMPDAALEARIKLALQRSVPPHRPPVRVLPAAA